MLMGIGGKSWRIPWQQALEFARAIYVKAKEAEEFAKANRVIADNALLLRAGVPVGLSNNRKIIDETIKEAVHNRDLRRHLPGGVKSQAVFGVPQVIAKPPVQIIKPNGVAPSTRFGGLGGR